MSCDRSPVTRGRSAAKYPLPHGPGMMWHWWRSGIRDVGCAQSTLHYCPPPPPGVGCCPEPPRSHPVAPTPNTCRTMSSGAVTTGDPRPARPCFPPVSPRRAHPLSPPAVPTPSPPPPYPPPLSPRRAHPLSAPAAPAPSLQCSGHLRTDAPALGRSAPHHGMPSPPLGLRRLRPEGGQLDGGDGGGHCKGPPRPRTPRPLSARDCVRRRMKTGLWVGAIGWHRSGRMCPGIVGGFLRVPCVPTMCAAGTPGPRSQDF